jgi:hypothetical protein
MCNQEIISLPKQNRLRHLPKFAHQPLTDGSVPMPQFSGLNVAPIEVPDEVAHDVIEFAADIGSQRF